MNTPLKFPFYARASLFLIGLYVFISMLSIAQEIILPVLYATVIAILISPVVNFLVKKKINRAVAIAGVLFIAFLLSASLIILLSSRVSLFMDSLPQLAEKFQELHQQTIKWTSGNLNISRHTISSWIADRTGDFIKNSSASIGTTLITMGGVLAAAFLTPVYVFLILFYQPHLVEFIHQLFGTGNNKVSEILTETKAIIQSYLIGLFVEFVIVAVLNSAGLLLLGIEYAILLGITGALLNIIPFLGGIIGVLIFMIIALVTKSPVYVLYVFALYAFIQFVDNYFIVPKIVGSKVKLNALISLIVVFAGAALWGIPGMFLSIPLVAIIKLILDRIEPLKPWGFLLGDTPVVSIELNFKDISKKLPRIISPFKRKEADNKGVFRDAL